MPAPDSSPHRSDAVPGVDSPSRSSDEASLVARVRTGDAVAFERLFRCYYPALCLWAARLVEPDTAAEDIVQDVFRRIWERRAQWTIETTVAAYLYRATKNGVLDYRKHERVVHRWAETAATDATVEPGHALREPAPDEVLYAVELRAAIDQVASQLPARCRQTFLLKWTHGLTYPEIAEVMQVSPKTVEMQMTRAYKVLRARLKVFLA